MKLSLDSLDLKIIEQFYKLKKDEEVDLPDMIKRILKINSKKIGDREYHLIQRRIFKMSESGIFKIGKNSHLKFELDLDKVFKQRFSFPTRRSTGFAILIDGKFQIFEL